MAKKFLNITTPTAMPKTKGLYCDFQPNAVPIFEDIGDRLLWAVYADREGIELMNLDTLPKSSSRELMYVDRWIVDARRSPRPSLDRNVDPVRNLRRELVVGKRRNQTDDPRGDPPGHDHEIGMA